MFKCTPRGLSPALGSFNGLGAPGITSYVADLLPLSTLHYSYILLLLLLLLLLPHSFCPTGILPGHDLSYLIVEEIVCY